MARRRCWTIALALLLASAHADAAPGDLDLSFGIDIIPYLGVDPLGPGITKVEVDAPYDYVNADGLALQADGKILAVCGEGNLLHRFTPDGLPDPSFGPGLDPRYPGAVIVGSTYELRDVAAQTDGRIVAVGLRHRFDIGRDFGAVLRFLEDGSPDPTFGIAGSFEPPSARNEELHSVVVQSDGRIVTAGRLRAKKDRFVVRRLLEDGSSDGSFGGGGQRRSKPDRGGGFAREVLVNGDGRVFAVGGSRNVSGDDFAVLAYDSTGRLDPGFGDRGRAITNIARFDIADGAALQSDGKIVVAGASQPFGWEESFVVLRYLEDGSLDPAFGVTGVVTTDFGGEAEAYAVAVQPDGKIVAAGSAEEEVALARYLPDGALDTAFGTSGLVRTPIPATGIDYAEALAILLQPDGKILVLGAACAEGQDCGFHFLARYEG